MKTHSHKMYELTKNCDNGNDNHNDNHNNNGNGTNNDDSDNYYY